MDAPVDWRVDGAAIVTTCGWSQHSKRECLQLETACVATWFVINLRVRPVANF